MGAFNSGSSGGGGVSLNATLTALSNFNTNGFLCQTALATFVGRTITEGTGIDVTNGSGVSGNPTIALDINGLTSKASPVSADSIPLYDSEAGAIKKVLISNLPSGGAVSDASKYTSTMTTGGTAAANTAAFLADVAAASTAGKILWIPAGEYDFGYNDGTSMTVALSEAGTKKVIIRGAPGGLTKLKIQSGSQEYLTFSALGAVTDYTVTAVNTVTSGANLSTTSEVTSLTISSPPGSIDMGEMVSVFSDDLLPGYETSDERNYQHWITEAYTLTGSDVLLGRKLPRTMTTGYCRLRRYNNANIIVDIDDITFVADGNIYSTGVTATQRPTYTLAIEGVRSPIIGAGFKIESAWAGGVRFTNTMGAVYRGQAKQLLNNLTGVVVLGYNPAFYGANLNPRIESTTTFNGRHTPTTVFYENAFFTITGATVGSTTTLNYTGAQNNPAIGDRIEISGIVGTLSALNGTKQTITARTGTTASGTVTFAYNSTGLAYTSGGIGNMFQPEAAYGIGEVEGMEVIGATVLFSNGIAFDSHANALRTKYSNCSAKYPYTLTAGSITPTAFTFRGNSESVEGFYGERLTRFLNLDAFSYTTGLDNVVRLSGIHLHDQQDKASNIAYIVPTGASGVTDYRKILIDGMRISGGVYMVANVPANCCDLEINNFSFEGDWGISGAAQYMFTFASAGKTQEIKNSTFNLYQSTTSTEVRIGVVNNGTAIYRNCVFKGLKATGNYPFTISGSGGTIQFINCEFEFDSSATDNTVRLVQVNNVTGAVEFDSCRIKNGAKLQSSRGLVYSTGASASTTVTVRNLTKDSNAVVIVGSSSTAGTYTVSESMLQKAVRAAAATTAGTLSLPANHRIDSIDIINTTANAVTGGLKIGTTNGGTDIVAAQAVGSNGLVSIADASILKRLFSTSASQTLYFDAVSSFNSASLNITVKYSEI